MTQIVNGDDRNAACGAARAAISARFLPFTATAALAAALLAAPAAAQENAGAAGATPSVESQTADADAIADIVVTANRRAESLQRVGIAVAAFGADQLQALGITSSQDITKFVPGVTTSNAQGGYLQTVSIRGVTQTDFNPHQEGPIAVYADDVYISSIQGQLFSTFDGERVEVLKGPQGTLFGRNATGGLANYISRKPTDTFNGYVEGRYGRFDQRSIEGAVGGPIAGDKVMFRIAGTYSAHDPILRNPIGPDGWEEESYAGRAHLLLKPSDGFEALFTGRYGKSTISISGAAQFSALIAILDANGNQIDGRFLGRDETARVITPAGPVGTRPVPGGDFFGYVDPDGPGRTSADRFVGRAVSFTSNPGKDENYSTSWGLTSRMTGTVGDITVVNLLDYSHFKWRFGDTLLGGNTIPFAFDTFANGIEQISDEFRVSGDHGAFRWTAGLYYLNIDVDAGSTYGFLPGGLTGDGAVPGDQVFAFRQQTSSLSGFAQIEYDLSPQFTAILGGRYTSENKSFDYRADLVRANGDLFLNLSTFNKRTTPLATLKQDLYAIKAGLNYTPTDDVLLYATFNRGVKGGGFNAPTNPNAIPLSGFIVSPEVLYAYEAGFKTAFDGRRLIFNGSAYYYDYNDYQGFRGEGITTFIVNNDARTYGAELELRYSPVRDLNVQLSGAYTNAKVSDVQVAPGFVADRRPAFAPRWQANTLIQYDIPTPVGRIGLQADASYRTAYFVQLINFQNMRQKGYPLVGARVSLTGDDDAGWQIFAAGRNLTAERYKTTAYDLSASFGNGNVSYNMPRTWEVGARFSF